MTVHLYMGKEFAHTHEMQALRKFVSEMQSRFGASDQYYFILANYFVGGHEIDLTVLKENAIIVIELKECGGSPITGAENGDWMIDNPGDRQAVINPGRENPYQQVKGYRFAWIDILRRRQNSFLTEQKASQLDFYHVSGFVAISPKLDPSSRIDIRPLPWFKVVGLDELCDAVYDQRSPALSFSKDELAALAQDVLRLKPADVEAFLEAGALPREQPEAVITTEQLKAYCWALMAQHKDWTELLVLPTEALRFVPVKLTPAEHVGPFPAASGFRHPTRALERSPITLEACVHSTKGPLVILGGPGQGKTAALELLTMTCAHKVVEDMGGLVPILVKLGRYDQQERDLLSLITMSLRARGLQVERQQVEHFLGNGGVPILLLFDGLDEVRASERLSVKQDIESLLLGHPAQKVIITCRTGDYDEFGLRLEDEERWELCRFNEQDVRKFLIDYYWHVERSTQKGRLLFEQLRQQGLLDFAQMPLHLGLIIGLAQEDAALPANKGQLYKRFVDMMLQLEAKKGKALSEWMVIERFLAHLALVMHERETRQISLRETRQAIGRYWQELWEAGACSLRRDQVFDRVWNSRLLAKTDGEAGFRHAVLQDYFVAKRLEYMVEDAEEDLYRFVGEPHWDEAFALLAGMVDDASALVEFISRKESPLLTLRCLTNARRLDDLARMMVVDRLLDQLFDPDTLARHFIRLYTAAFEELRSAEEVRGYLAPAWIERLLSAEPLSAEMILLAETYLGPAAEEGLIRALEDADTEDERARSALLLGYLGSEVCIEPLLSCIYDANPDLRYHAIESLIRRGGRDAISALETPLSDTDPAVRQMTITVLGALCGGDVTPLPKSFIEGLMPLTSGEQVDGAVVEEVKEWLRPALSDPSEAVQTEAVIVLGCLGEADVTDRLIWLLGDPGFDYYQKTRAIRALGRIRAQKALDAISLFHLELLESAPQADQQHIRDWDSPISFEIAAALSYGNSGPLLHVVARWKDEGFSSSVEGAGKQQVSIRGYRIDRLRFYREKLVPAIVARGAEALDDLFECIAAASDGLYEQGVEAEANYLLDRIGESAKIEELIHTLRAGTSDFATRTQQDRRLIEHAVYLAGQQSVSLVVTDQDPLLRAMLEDGQLVELLIHVGRDAKWDEARFIAVRALAHYIRVAGRETPLGRRALQEVVEPWLKEWEEEGDRGRHKKGLVLSLCGDSEAAALLLQSLEAQDIHARFQAAVLLLEYHHEQRGIPTLVDILRDPDAQLRAAAAAALGKVEDPRSTAALVELMRDPDDLVRWAAVQGLRASGDESAVEALIDALNDEDPHFREQAIEALGRIGGERAGAGLCSVVLYDGDSRLRRLAVDKLTDPSEPAVEAVQRSLRDEDPMVRSAASSRLSLWTQDESDVVNLRRVYAVLKEDDSRLLDKVRLLSKLWRSGTREAVKAIEDALQDPDEIVRLSAIQTLAVLGSVGAVPALRRLVEEDAGAFNDQSLADEARKAIEEIQRRSGDSDVNCHGG